jgi:TatA/E family protein of Tat protein translocase
MNLGGPELLIVFVILALLFGAGRVPHIARTLGQSNREFRRALKEGFGEGPKCDSCGAPLASDARFCANCGHELEQGSVPSQAPAGRDGKEVTKVGSPSESNTPASGEGNGGSELQLPSELASQKNAQPRGASVTPVSDEGREGNERRAGLTSVPPPPPSSEDTGRADRDSDVTDAGTALASEQSSQVRMRLYRERVHDE